MDVAENDFDMDAILNRQSSVRGVFVSMFFLPKEWV
jgi:hypothetical protein